MTSRQIVLVPDRLEELVSGSFEIPGFPGDGVGGPDVQVQHQFDQFHQHGQHRPRRLTAPPLSRSRRLSWRRSRPTD